MIIIIQYEIYIIYHDVAKINLERLSHLIPYKRNEGENMWQNLIVVIHI